jgi:quercetin dioxygenase-like cupin family protein
MKPGALLAGAVLSGAVLAGLSFAQVQPRVASGPKVKVLSAVDIEEKLDGASARASTLEVTFEPGDSSLPHRHPGPVFGYVIEGDLQFKVEGQELRKLKAGDTFYEPRMVLHEVARNPSETTRTRVLATIVHARDAKSLVIPVSTNEK